MSQNELTAKVHELREYKRMADELHDLITGIEDKIKAQMTAADADTLTGSDWKATWKQVSSTRLDSKALKQAAPELYQRFTKQTTTRRFTLA